MPRLTGQVRIARPSRLQVRRWVRRSTTIWSRSTTVVQPPDGSQAMVRFADGSSTAVQPERRSTIGTVSRTPLMVGARNASGRPPGAS